MPLIKASLYALGLIAAFGGVSAAIGFLAGFNPLGIVLVLCVYWLLAINVLRTPYSILGETHRVQRALAFTIAFRILLALLPCTYVDFLGGLFANWLITFGHQDAVPRPRAYGFGMTTVLGAVQAIIGLAQFALMYTVSYKAFPPPQADPDRCRSCGYDVRASHQFGRCPECGAPTPTRSNE